MSFMTIAVFSSSIKTPIVSVYSFSKGSPSSTGFRFFSRSRTSSINLVATGYEPEDFYFCKKLRANGVSVYVDHDVSQEVAHVGDFEYTLNSHGEIA